jgi:two-component system cell cycle sensor histidine kinase/response regulator CckA
MRGYAELLLDSLASDPRRVDAQEIMNAADRAGTLTKQLLAFSRRQVVTPRVVALDGLVARAEQMLRRLIGENIALTVTIPEGIAPVRADSGQLEQVVMNLSINARDAMPGGGRLRIDLANVELDDAPTKSTIPGTSTLAGAPRAPALKPGRYVRLSVADTGSGMSPETVSRIFEPFFTTKEEGCGTGLGLAMVYGIVQQAGGAIDVVTAINEGTTFQVYLPAAPETHADADDSGASAPADGARVVPTRGSETVLLVDDEPRLATLIAGALRAQGYTVLEAANGQEALDIVRTNHTPIHLLLTDVFMPGMNGRELSELVVGIRCQTRVLFMSGYSDDAVLRQGIETSSAHFLQKPFSIGTLTTKIREALV